MTPAPVILRIAPVDSWLTRAHRQLAAIDVEMARLEARQFTQTAERVRRERRWLVAMIAVTEAAERAKARGKDDEATADEDVDGAIAEVRRG